MCKPPKDLNYLETHIPLVLSKIYSYEGHDNKHKDTIAGNGSFPLLLTASQ